jgi:hypothetical protein
VRVEREYSLTAARFPCVLKKAAHAAPADAKPVFPMNHARGVSRIEDPHNLIKGQDASKQFSSRSQSD